MVIRFGQVPLAHTVHGQVEWSASKMPDAVIAWIGWPESPVRDAVRYLPFNGKIAGRQRARAVVHVFFVPFIIRPFEVRPPPQRNFPYVVMAVEVRKHQQEIATRPVDDFSRNVAGVCRCEA